MASKSASFGYVKGFVIQSCGAKFSPAEMVDSPAAGVGVEFALRPDPARCRERPRRREQARLQRRRSLIDRTNPIGLKAATISGLAETAHPKCPLLTGARAAEFTI